MKRLFTVCALIVLSFMLAAGAAFAQDEDMEEEMSSGMQSMQTQRVPYNAARNQVGFSVGPYYPARDKDDPADDDWETGADLTAMYTRIIGNHFAIQAGLHAYATVYDKNNIEGERSHSGMEVMALYIPIHKRIMPYIGGGFGVYANHIKVKVYDIKILDDDSSAGGVVLIGGVRAHITKRFFLGGFVKAWTNNQEVEFEDGHKETLAFGGSSVNFEVGFAL